ASAAPLLCAGVTVFAPLRRWGVRAGARVGVIGIGGVGGLALPFFRGLGCEAAGVTSVPDKLEGGLGVGAQQVASSTNAREIRALANRFEFLLCTVPARLDWITYLQTLKPNGVFCLVGAPPGLLQIPAVQLVKSQRAICGSDIGSPAAIRETLAFAPEHGIAAQVETAPMIEVNAALQRGREHRVACRMGLADHP